MSADNDCILSRCPTCARNNLKYRYRRKLQLFLPFRTHYFVEIYIMGRSTKMTQSNQYYLSQRTNTPRWVELPQRPRQEPSTLRIFFLIIGSSLTESRRTSLLSMVLNSPGNSFYDVRPSRCYRLDKNSLSSTDEQPSRAIYWSIFMRFRHYIAEHQKDWDTIMQLPTYAYNNGILIHLSKPLQNCP